MKFNFGNIVMIENGLVGVIVKSWLNKNGYNHDVYVRSYNAIKNYKENEIRHFIYDKELSDEDLEFY
jgi:hypothetical protein